MKYVELEILLTNGTRQKIAPVFDQWVDDKIIQIESEDSEKYVFSKSKVAKATFRVKEGEYHSLY